MVKKEESSYEEERRKRVLENLNKLENLGISKISKTLLEVAKSESKKLKCNSSPKSRKKFEVEVGELRRSSRSRNQVSYRDQVDETEFSSHRKRYCRSNLSNDKWREYSGRISSYEEQVAAFQRAEQIQNSLKNPSFVKTMVRSHVSSCFWLGLPSKFCKEKLPNREVRMVLEDEEGEESDVIYIGARSGLSGGWRGFAIEHHLEDGDSLVFELTQPTRFKIYIVKAIEGGEDEDIKGADVDNAESAKESADVDENDSAESAKESADVDENDSAESAKEERRKTRSSERLKKARKGKS